MVLPLLFQVEKDLGERIDVATKHPEKIAELQNDLENFEIQIKKEGSFWKTN
jgi:arylsulfatase A